jgi:hypothetical protein
MRILAWRKRKRWLLVQPNAAYRCGCHSSCSNTCCPTAAKEYQLRQMPLKHPKQRRAKIVHVCGQKAGAQYVDQKAGP